jgi:hypothetical protein
MTNSHADASGAVEEALGRRFRDYRDPRKAREWLDENWDRVRALFEIDRLRDWIFEPVLGAWKSTEPTTDERVRLIITQVAVANAAIAGLPGKLGIGVVVSMALEAYMAVAIGRRVGVRIDRTEDVWNYFGLFGGIAITILWLFRHLLGLFFSLFNLLPILPATALAEFVATIVVGTAFWTAFEEVREQRPFGLPIRSARRFGRHLQDLSGFLRRVVADTLSLENLKAVGTRLREWLTGENLPSAESLRGEIFCAAASSWLLLGRHDQLRSASTTLRHRVAEITVSRHRSTSEFRDRATATRSSARGVAEVRAGSRSSIPGPPAVSLRAGGLIQTAVGSSGARGGRRTKRSGCAA